MRNLSNARLFQCQIHVALKIDPESENHYPQVIEITEQYLKDEIRLTNIRQYIEVVRKMKFEFNDDIIQVNEKEYRFSDFVYCMCSRVPSLPYHFYLLRRFKMIS